MAQAEMQLNSQASVLKDLLGRLKALESEVNALKNPAPPAAPSKGPADKPDKKNP